MPRDGRENRERILNAAERLVIEGGYSATSLDAVIAEAATSKGAFFHHFASKAELAEALVRRYAAADVAELERALADTSGVTDPGGRLLSFLDWFVDRADALMGEQSSCLYVAVLTERELVATATAAPIEGAVRAWREAIAELVIEATSCRVGTTGSRAAGEPAVTGPDRSTTGTLSVEDLSDHVFVTFEGAFILARATGDPSHMRRQLVVLRALVAAWLGRLPTDCRAGSPLTNATAALG